MNSDLRIAIQVWEAEVDNEAARLIEQGTPPHKAVAEASRIISERRRTAALKEKP